MKDNEILHLVEDRLGELEESRDELIKLNHDNPEIFERLAELTERYNTAWDQCKNLLKGIETTESVRIGPFSRDKKSFSTKYKPELLPPEVLSTPGVVKQVDDKMIVELIARGVIAQQEVENASYEHSRAPSVRSNLQRATLPTLVDVK
jgi:predicted nuclease with TOPRIM domain